MSGCRDFTCAACKREFHASTSEEAMDAEFVKLYGHPEAESDEEIVSICDECFAELQKRRASRALPGQ